MKRTYNFETHLYAPELNRAYINNCIVPGYTPKNGTYEQELSALRQFLRLRPERLIVKVKNTGATKTLPMETITVSPDKKSFFLKWLKEKKEGEADFLQSDGSYKKLKYGYKIVSIKRVWG